MFSFLADVKKLDVQYGKPVKAPARNRRTITPILLVSILFFKWGLAYGLLDVMNFHIRQVMGLTHRQSTIMATAYYLAYIPGVLLVGGPTVRSIGYRLAFVFGLLLLGFGALTVSGAATKQSFPGIAVGMCLQGLGVSTLERSANPYATNCGPRGMRALRILVGQSCAALGTIFAPLIANKFLLAEQDPSLLEGNMAPACRRQLAAASGTDVTQPPVPRAAKAGPEQAAKLASIVSLYRGIGIIVLCFALLFGILLFRTTVVPELPQELAPKTENKRWQVWKHPIASKTYARTWAGFGANFINLGVQVTVAQFFMEHMVKNACTTQQQASKLFAVAQTLFFVGRLVAAGLECFPRIFKPRIVLWCAIMGAVICLTAGAFVVQTAAIVVACGVMFFESPSFPMIFESATAGLGVWTPLGEDIIILSITGGAVLPPLHGLLVDRIGVSKAWLLTASCYFLVWLYCWGNNLIPSWRRTLDKGHCDENRADTPSEIEKDDPAVKGDHDTADIPLKMAETRPHFEGGSVAFTPLGISV